MTINVKNMPIEFLLVFVALGTALVGFMITIIGAFLNGWTMFNGSNDFDKGFGIILIGNSTALVGVAIMVPAIIIMLYKDNIDTCGHN
jgi:uncharacterized membrane protein